MSLVQLGVLSPAPCHQRRLSTVSQGLKIYCSQKTIYSSFVRHSGRAAIVITLSMITRPNMAGTWDSRGLSFGLSKIVGVTVSGSQKLVPQTVVQQHILDKWNQNPARANFGVPNQYLGLEISTCTGNALRISPKTLVLLSTLSPLLERQIPAWTRTGWGSRFLALRTTNPQAIFDVWKDFAQSRDQMAELVRYSSASAIDNCDAAATNSYA